MTEILSLRDDRKTFAAAVREAIHHLQDPAYLQHHRLLATLLPTETQPSGEALRKLLLATLKELRPLGRFSPYDAAWRRYRHVVLRDLEGYTLEAIASATGVSNRQASRDYREATDELIELLHTPQLALSGL